MEAKYSLESRSVLYATRRRCSDVRWELRLIWVIIYLAVTHITQLRRFLKFHSISNSKQITGAIPIRAHILIMLNENLTSNARGNIFNTKNSESARLKYLFPKLQYPVHIFEYHFSFWPQRQILLFWQYQSRTAVQRSQSSRHCKKATRGFEQQNWKNYTAGVHKYKK